MAYIYGWALPPLEFFLALLLLTGTVISLSAVVTALLFISFIVAALTTIIRGRELDCHCFGARTRRKIGWALIFEDSLLLSAAVIVAFQATPQPPLESWSLFLIVMPGSTVLWPFLVDLAMAACVTALLWSSKPKISWPFWPGFLGKEE